MARARDVQADFAQLQREYRNMEQNRKAYTEESQNIIRRQQKSIDKLRKENESLKSELAMETRHASVKVSNAHAAKLSSLQEQGNLYSSKIAIQEKNIGEINKQIKLMQEKILIQRKKMGGVNAARENQLMVQKQIRILEREITFETFKSKKGDVIRGIVRRFERNTAIGPFLTAMHTMCTPRSWHRVV